MNNQYTLVEYIWHFIGIACVILLVGLLAFYWVSPSYVVRYELGSCNMTGLTVTANVYRGPDYTVDLIGVDYARAVQLVDSLNSELARHPYSVE